MVHLGSAAACAVIGIALTVLGIKAKRREVGIEGRVTMLVAGCLFLLGSAAYIVLGVMSALF